MTDSIAVLLSDNTRFIRRRFDARARSLGVSRAQWTMLFALSRNEGTNQAGLAEALDVETITVGRMVDRLEEAGLVERRADPADRRAWRLYLTARAHPILDQLRIVAEGVMDDALAGFSNADKEQLTALLTRLRCNIASRGPTDQATLAVKSAGAR